MAKKPINLNITGHASLFASQKSCGKTTTAVFVADVLTLNALPFKTFQVDEQKRLSTMIGDVTDLRANRDELIDDPTLLTRTLVPYYDAVLSGIADKTSVLLDIGANETENVCNFLRDVGFDDDVRQAQFPVLAFVPFLPLDPESCAQSAFTVSRLLAAVPSTRVILVENRHGGTADRISTGSLAETEYKHLLDVAKHADYVVMPAIAREYWAPYEGSGVRFLKAISMPPDEGARLLKRSVGEVKIAKAALVRFWIEMHRQLGRIISLPLGGK